MKKLNKLFAILIAVLGVSTTAKADTSILQESDGWQKITALPSNLGDYYYVFVDNSQDLMMTLGTGANQGNSYKTMWYQTSSNPVEDLNKVWTLESNTAKGNVSIRNVAYDHLCLQTEWNAAWNFRTHDNGGTNTGVNVSWTGFTLAYASSKWSIQNGNYPDSGYLGPWNNTIQANAEVACNKTGSAIGYFQVYAISKTNFHKLYVDANTTEEEEVNLDFSVFVGNPKIEGNGALWSSTTGCGCNYTTNKQDGTTGGFLENWSGSGPVGKVYQTLTGLPNGVYELKMKAFRNNNISANNEVEDAVYVFANNDQTQVTTEDVTTYYTVRTTLTNGTLEFGLRQDTRGSQWIGLDEVSLTYFGVDLSELKASVQATYNELQGLSQDAVSSAFASIMNNLLNKYKTLPNTESGLTDANNELKNLIATYHLVSSEYAKLQLLITTCESILTNSAEFEDGAEEAFSTAINTAKSTAEAATTADAINAEYNTLEGARQTYVQKADPTNDTYFDYTFLMTNPEVSTESHWTNGRYNTGEQYTGAPDNRYLDSWNGASQDIYQAVTNLPNGYYIVKAVGRASTSCTSAYIYLNDTQVEIDKAGSTGNDLGYGWKWYTTDKTIISGVGTAKIGFACNSTNSQWAGADDFHFYYYGYDVESAQSTVTYLKNGIAGRLDSKMNADVRTQMEEVYNNADASKTTRKELEPMIAALRAVIDVIDASIADYEKLIGYINMTKEFTDVTTYETKYNNGEYTTDDVETVRQELNVMRFDAASLIFRNNIEVTGWEGTMGGKNTSSQHWNGTTTTKYYDNNSWNGTTHSTTTDITLPAGSYVLKAALRSNANTTLRLTVLDKTVNVDGKGDQGYGIDVNGKATFAEDATYANDDKGRGWEWEFVKFELTEETTVTLTVECDYNDVYGWASFSDITLWMDDDTYVTVYRKELDAPLAEAKALVNTKPMGATENAELTSAIALGEGTISKPAQLNAAIDALKVAVANANAWVTAYNEAKAPLVAALERFEADYNDGANGALRPMSDETWSTLLSAAGTAAKAKDVTDSYASFATDAETFNKVMDDTEPSIILYKKWAGLITSVQAYYDNIKQDAALSTAISTASAESSKATDASLTSATEALNAAYQEALDGDFDASIFLGDNLDFESGTGTALDKLVFEIPGWDIEYNGNVNENARIQPETYGESNAIRIRSNWEDAPTTMRVYKEVVLPSGSYNLSMTLLTSITGSGVNLTYYELNGERTMLSSDTYKKVTAPSIELEEPTILLLSLGLTGTTGNNAQELYADSIALACNAKTLYQRTLEGIKALAEDGEPTLVITNVYNEYKDKEGSLTAEQKTTAIAVMNNAIVIDAANDVVTSLIKNADFTGGTNSYNVQGSGGKVEAPKEWTFGYTFEAWNDTYVTEGFFNLWAGVIKYGELSQVIKNLPNGTYKLTADMVTSSTDGSSIAAIYGAPTNGNIARSKNADNSSDYVNYEVYFKVVDNQATIGARTDNHYFKLKNIQLEYVEEDAIAVDNGILYQEAFINRGNTTWDITEIAPNASEASIYMSSPNALIIANEGQVSNANNVIVDGIAASLVLNDGGYAFNTTADFTATALNYAREFTKDTWLTVCLPFAYPIPENVKVETLGAIDLDTKTFTFDEVTGTMEANTPYLIKNSTETAALFASFGKVEVEATPAAMNVTITADNSEHQGEFIGTYTTVKTDALMEDGAYDILFFGTDGQLYYLSQDITTKVVNIKPFRAYIRLPKGAINWSDGQQARVRHRNSEMTDIESSTLNAQPSTEVYDLMGRKVNTMKKGNMYIVNGRKVVIR